jgi:hypothetical protein
MLPCQSGCRKLGMEKVRPEDTERMIQLLDRDGDSQVRSSVLSDLKFMVRTAPLGRSGLAARMRSRWASKSMTRAQDEQ